MAVTPLGGQSKLVTVEVGQGEDRLWLVLGVTPAGIRTLHTLPPQAEMPVASAPAGLSFAQLMGRAQRPPEDAHHGR